MKKLLSVIAVLIFCVITIVPLKAYNMKEVIAYPVPFNPKKTILNIGETAPVAGYIIRAEIFDINGDRVCEKSGSNMQLIWNGRDDSGRYVKPGLYIVKVTVENSSTGDYGKKIIRILVDY